MFPIRASLLPGHESFQGRIARTLYAVILVFQVVVFQVVAFARAEEIDSQPATPDFQETIWPILQARCLVCHGPDEQEGELRVDSRSALLTGGQQGPAIQLEDSERSLLLRAVRHESPDLAMPPKEKLPDTERAALQRWIEAGAPWPADAKVPSTTPSADESEPIGDAWSDPRNPIVRIFRGERLDLWSLRPIQSPAIPSAPFGDWARNPIDHFVGEAMGRAGLTPAPEADRRTLARRLYFDLIGLPPTPEQLDQFLSDDHPDAYERLVDQLLATPQHGQHAARMWLDVIRYSDSNGFDWDEFRPRAWLMRDYAIRSMNQDKPFDRFVMEQLAGDELLSGTPRSPSEQDALVATGFLRLGPQDNSASLFNEQARARAEWMSDLVETMGSAFLGLTFSCCRCHDHKHDPLSQADYYRLRAFFEPLRYADDLPLDLMDEQHVIRAHNERLDARIAELEKARESAKKLAEGETEKEERREGQERGERRENAGETDRDQQLEKEIQQLRAEKREFQFGLLATDARDDIAATHVLYQGNHQEARERVEPGFISFLRPDRAAIHPPENGVGSGRRLALASWIVSPENPLTARVLANRIWQSHFGAGMVATPNDFGFAGAPPTHPELLDWLAREVIDGGWSMKRLRRLVVTSATYRQRGMDPAVEQDPEQARLLAGRNPRRLSAEQLRDALLAVSGLLDARLGGPPAWPELPSEILQANPAFLDDNATRTKGWYPSPAADQDVRSILLVQKRTVRIPFLETFDLPENSTSCAVRPMSIVAPQALSLLNSSLAARASMALAEAVEREAAEKRGTITPAIESLDDGNVETRRYWVNAAFRRTLQREPDETEMDACLRLLERRSLAELCRVLLNVNEFVFVD